MSDLYSADQVIDKDLYTLRALPYFDGVPTAGYFPKQLGTFQAGVDAGKVYSWIDADPANNRPTLWWVFYPRGSTGSYYYMPHNASDFDVNKLEQQGAVSEDEKNNPATWYEKILNQVLPVVVIAVVGAAAVRGYFSRGQAK